MIHQKTQGQIDIGIALRCHSSRPGILHHHEFEVVMVHAERRLLHIRRHHAHLVIFVAQVKLGEELGVTEFILELINKGNWNLVLDNNAHVEGMVIDAKPLGWVSLVDQQDRGGEGGGRLPQ